MNHQLVVKIQLYLALILAFNISASLCFAQQWRQDRYDPRWLPITNAEITRQTLSNANDAVALYRLYETARYQHKQQPYFSALQKLKREQPQNGVVLATYCAVLMDSNTLYGFGQFKFKVDPKEGTIDSIKSNLVIAKRLSPKLWIIPFVEADVAGFSNGNVIEGAEKTILLSRKAIELAPTLSYPQMKLGYWLVSDAMQKKADRAASVPFYKKAQTLLPVNSDASFLLLNVYRFYAPNPAEARKVGQQLIATIPPQARSSKETKQRLIKQGIKPP